MKKFVMAVLCTLLTLSVSYAQKVHQNQMKLFGSYNASDEYTGDLADLASALMPDATTAEASNAIQSLKNDYQEMTGATISNNELDDMLDPTPTNYDIWMSLFESGKDSYLLRSIIMNIKANL